MSFLSEHVIHVHVAIPPPKPKPVKTEAKHADPAINRLYRARRKAATEADWAATSYKRSKGHADLARIEDELRALDPGGEWRREGYNFDKGEWEVKAA